VADLIRGASGFAATISFMLFVLQSLYLNGDLWLNIVEVTHDRALLLGLIWPGCAIIWFSMTKAKSKISSPIIAVQPYARVYELRVGDRVRWCLRLATAEGFYRFEDRYGSIAEFRPPMFFGDMRAVIQVDDAKESVIDVNDLELLDEAAQIVAHAEKFGRHGY
jgi:hypothetical protein